MPVLASKLNTQTGFDMQKWKENFQRTCHVSDIRKCRHCMLSGIRWVPSATHFMKEETGQESGQNLCVALRPGTPGMTGAKPNTLPSPPMRQQEPRRKVSPRMQALSLSFSALPYSLTRVFSVQVLIVTSECPSSGFR